MTWKKSHILPERTRPEKCQSCGAKLPNWPRYHTPHFLDGRVCGDCYRLNPTAPVQGRLFEDAS